MMTPTYPTTRSSSHHELKNGLKELQSKKEDLLSLEAALKKHINELRELCLKEGELTGHLPVDYPLQPREPIPQIRRRTNNTNNNDNNVSETSNSIIPPSSSRLRQLKLDQQIPSFPTRPMSTNSTSSSISTASSNNKNAQPTTSNLSASATTSSGRANGFSNIHNAPVSMMQRNNNSNTVGNKPIRYDQSMLPNQFKRPTNLPMALANFDSDTIGSTRASSTASSSSFGSGASSTISAPVMPTGGYRNSNYLDAKNLHGRSYSESLSINDQTQFKQATNLVPVTPRVETQSGGNIYDEPNINLSQQPSGLPPPRPPRGLTHHRNQLHSSLDTVDGGVVKTRQRQLLAATATTKNKIPESSNDSSKQLKTRPIDVSSLKPPSEQRFKMNEIKNLQPYFEETKPFQMADFYKYSSKHRQQQADYQKTTHQLQQEALRKNHYLKYSYDDQLHASVRLIEKSGQKLMEATARAIAANPGLAEKINNILPNTNHNDKY